jgi:plastocyanin
MRRTRRQLLAAGTGVVTALAGCTTGGSSSDSEEYDVGMGGSFFDPERVEVSVGEPVVWKNTGSRAHTVTAYEDAIPDDADYFASGGFDSQSAAEDGWRDGFGGAIESGQVYERAFDVPGEYGYFCVPHEPGGMVGTVVVSE